MNIERPSNDFSESLNSVARSIQRVLEKLSPNEFFNKIAEIFRGTRRETREELDDLHDEMEAEGAPVFESSEVIAGLENLSSTYIIGDSIAEGLNIHAPNGEGFRSRSTRFILERLTEVLPTLPDEITSVTVYAGINDVWNSSSESVDRAESNIRQMAGLISASGRKPVLCAIHNMEGEDQANVDRARELNTRIRNFAHANGYKFVDFENSEFTSSGVHPGVSGYEEMAGIINSQIA